jgi:hypothetical protein
MYLCTYNLCLKMQDMYICARYDIIYLFLSQSSNLVFHKVCMWNTYIPKHVSDWIKCFYFQVLEQIRYLPEENIVRITDYSMKVAEMCNGATAWNKTNPIYECYQHLQNDHRPRGRGRCIVTFNVDKNIRAVIKCLLCFHSRSPF